MCLVRSRTDWWTWADGPTTTDNDKQLALDPAYGGAKPRPLVTDMLALAAKRRVGQHPVYTTTWGAAIGAVPSLKTLELILETFSVKERQLDTVVECAKTWKFPLNGTQYELVYDGKVESMKGAKASNRVHKGCSTIPWVRTVTEFPVRIVRFRRKKADLGSCVFGPLSS